MCYTLHAGGSRVGASGGGNGGAAHANAIPEDWSAEGWDAPSPHPEPPKRGTVLVVDDQAVNRVLLAAQVRGSERQIRADPCF